MKYELTKAITLTTLKEALATLFTAPAGENIELDFSQVAKIDSAALSYVLHSVRSALKNGYTIQLSHLPSSFTELADLYGLNHLLQPYLSSASSKMTH